MPSQSVHVEVDFTNSNDLKENSRRIGELTTDGYDITSVKKIGDQDKYAVTLERDDT